MGLILSPSTDKEDEFQFESKDTIPASEPTDFGGERFISPAEQAQAEQSSNQNNFVQNVVDGFKDTALAKTYRFLDDEISAAYDGPAIDPNLTDMENYEARQEPALRAVWRGVQNMFTSEVDPAYNKADHYEELTKGLPRVYHADIMAWDNLDGALRARARVLDSLEHQRHLAIQNDGGVTRLASQLIDLDLPLVAVSGGALAAAKTARLLVRAGQKAGLGEKASGALANLAVGVSGGVQAGAIVGAAEMALVEGADASTLMYSTIMGGAMGGGLAPLGRAPVVDKAITDLGNDTLRRIRTDDPTLSMDIELDATKMRDESGTTYKLTQRVDEQNARSRERAEARERWQREAADGQEPLRLRPEDQVPLRLRPEDQVPMRLTPDFRVRSPEGGTGPMRFDREPDVPTGPAPTGSMVFDRVDTAAGTPQTGPQVFDRGATEQPATEGGVGPQVFDRELDATQIEPRRGPVTIDMEPVDGPSRPDSTVGARQVDDPDADMFMPENALDDTDASENIQAWSDMANRANHDSGFYDRKREDMKEKLYHWATSKAWSGLSGVGLHSRMITSKSPMMNWLGNNVLESANSYGRGVSTSSVLMEQYHRIIQSALEGVEDATNKWAQRNGKTLWNLGHGVSNEGRKEFNRAVMIERNNRAMGKPLTTDADVKAAADALDETADVAHQILKGHEGTHSVDGFANARPKKHYTPYVWDGASMSRLINLGVVTKESLAKDLGNAYLSAGMFGKDAHAVARAVITRARTKGDNMDQSLANLMNADSQEFLREVLADDGVAADSIDAIVERLTAERRKGRMEGFAKERNEVDMDFAITTADGSALSIVDIMSQDLFQDWQRYTRRVAGAAALARKGIINRTQRKEVIATVQAEQRALGEPVTPSGELEAMFSNFDGAAVMGWSSIDNQAPAAAGRTIAIMKRLANLAWLNKLGLTQLGETGMMIWQNGATNFWNRGMKTLWDKSLRENRQALLDDMAHFTGNIGRDQKHFAPHLQLDEMNARDAADLQDGLEKFVNGLDKFTSKAMYVQSYTSLFNHMRKWQQQVAATGMSDKVMRTIKASMDNNQALSDLELAKFFDDFGIDQAMITELEALIENGTIKFDDTGSFVDQLNMSDWEPDLAWNFGGSIVRNMNQNVQKSMAGESDAWMHTTWGSALTHLKTFSMQASQKQFVRHARHGKANLMGLILAGTGTAMVASYTRSAIGIHDKEMSAGDHAWRAIGYGNMTGWVPLYYDPLMTMLGLDDARFNQYGPHSETALPILEVFNGIRRSPGAAVNALRGEADWHDKQAMRSLPFSNMYIIGDILTNAGQK